MLFQSVSLGDVPDMVRGRDGTEGGRLLLVVGEPLAGEVGASALRDLEDDGSLDVPIADISIHVSPDQRRKAHLAASNTAFAVDVEVTFYRSSKTFRLRLKGATHDGLDHTRRHEEVSMPSFSPRGAYRNSKLDS